MRMAKRYRGKGPLQIVRELLVGGDFFDLAPNAK